MKKVTVLLFALMAFAFAIQVNAQPAKAPMNSKIFDDLPSGFTQLGGTSIYYSVTQREASGPGVQTGISLLGKINNQYYSSTYESNGFLGLFPRAGAGFIAAFQVNGGTAAYLNAATGTSSGGVTMTARIEPQGEVAALITYSLKNNNNQAVTVNAGVWGDIMIGNNDNAPLEPLKNSQETVYGIKMKYSNNANAPLLCMLFGEGVTGVVSSADNFWFGYYYNNYSASQMAGNYSTNIENYMQEGGGYDCGLGFCWKNREIGAGETLELSYVVSVGEVEYEEPFVPGDDRFEYNVEAFDIPEWNDFEVAHPAHVWGYYEHPYGQHGYIEYMVDGTRGEWTRIPTELISGEDFDLPFDMFFDPDVTTTHTLKLRFNDGLDNTEDMDASLSWTDVRSIDINGFEDRVYNGEPQIFDVTIGDENLTFGENGEYINPGDYSFAIEGAFEENTIGINEVEFSILKAQSDVQVTIPDDVEYDGLAHGATVVSNVGADPIITYINAATGEVLTEAPIEVGVYVVIVEIPENEFYYGMEPTSFGQFEIYAQVTGVTEINVDNKVNNEWYTIDGRRVVAPTAPGIYINNGKKYIVK